MYTIYTILKKYAINTYRCILLLVTMELQHCGHCEYEWESRIRFPKACPRCKNRLDYNIWRREKWLQ
jgi:predicted Zn-ribbon and HTH transcriptional regulator